MAHAHCNIRLAQGQDIELHPGKCAAPTVGKRFVSFKQFKWMTSWQFFIAKLLLLMLVLVLALGRSPAPIDSAVQQGPSILSEMPDAIFDSFHIRKLGDKEQADRDGSSAKSSSEAAKDVVKRHGKAVNSTNIDGAKAIWTPVAWSEAALLIIFCFCPCVCIAMLVLVDFLVAGTPDFLRSAKSVSNLISMPNDNRIPPQNEAGGLYLDACNIQALINLAGVLCGFILVCLVTPRGETSAPSWTLTGVIPLMLFGTMVERKLLHIFGGSFRCKSEYRQMADSQVERADTFTDGCGLALIFHNDHIIHGKFVQMFQLSSSSILKELAPLVDAVHLWGFAAAFLVLSQLLTFLLSGATGKIQRTDLQPFTEEDMKSGKSLRRAGVVSGFAEAAGFKVLAARMDSMTGDREKIGNTFVSGLIIFSQALLEAAPQGTFNITLIMLLGVQSLLAQPVTLASCLLSVVSLVKKGFLMLSNANTLRRIVHGSELMVPALFAAFGLTLICIAAWNVARLYYIETCPHHAWQITSGCISL